MTVGDSSEMELQNATNRDMFSWLLFNSENIAAPMGNLGAETTTTSMAATTTAAAVSSSFAATHHAPLEGIDDPFRMLPSDETMGLSQTSASAIASTSMTMATNSAAAMTAAGLSPHAAGMTPLGFKPSPKRRAKKTPTDNAGVVMPGIAPVTSTGAIPSTDGLLRHLQNANNVLLQKQQDAIAAAGAAAAAAAMSPVKQESSRSSGSDSPDQLRKLKLERNRESARECRRRKREHILGVEERCRQLERENMELRGQLKAGKEAMKQEEREKDRICEELEKMIQSGASEKELAEKIENFEEQYSDYGHGRRSALDYHLHQIERLLLPTQVTKMCIWALRQDDSFWHDEEDETSLPVILGKELGLSDEQKKKIQAQRGPFLTICENLKNALSLLSELKTLVVMKNTTLDTEMDKLQNILTPTQRAKFIVWVTNNQACMHLLNKLWRSVL